MTPAPSWPWDPEHQVLIVVIDVKAVAQLREHDPEIYAELVRYANSVGLE